MSEQFTSAQAKRLVPPRSCSMGILRLTHAQLAALLGLPAASRIDAITNEAYFASGEVGIRIEHESIPLSQEGSILPEIKSVLEARSVSTRVHWDANNVMRGVAPVIYPDAGKLAALLERVSNYLASHFGDEPAELRNEAELAVAELREQATDVIFSELYGLARDASIEVETKSFESILSRSELSSLIECPQGHHLKEGECRYDYCSCSCERCRRQCDAGRRGEKN